MKHIHGSRKSVSGYELCLRKHILPFLYSSLHRLSPAPVPRPHCQAPSCRAYLVCQHVLSSPLIAAFES